MDDRNRTPQLLVSVRNADEARAAVAGGADWIDLKEPDRGPLGPVDIRAAAAAAAVTPTCLRMSAAAGELRDWSLGGGRALLSESRIDLIKLGLADCGSCGGSNVLASAVAPRIASVVENAAAAGKRVVLAAYADAGFANAPSAAAVRDISAALGLPWLLLDTFDKRRGRLLDVLPPAALRRFLVSCRAVGLQVAAAGRLRASDLAALPYECLDIVAVRSAACGGDRSGAVQQHEVRALKEQLLSASARVALN